MTTAWIFRRTKHEVKWQLGGIAAMVAAFVALGALAGTAALGARSGKQLAALLEHDVHVIAYVREDVTAERVDALAEILRRLPAVVAVVRVDSAEALRRLRAAAQPLDGAAGVLNDVEDGFLPRSLEITMSPSERLAERSKALAARLRKIDGIAEVDTMESELGRLLAWVALGRWLGGALFTLAALAGLSLMVWSITRGRQQRRELAETLSLLGESPAGIRRPYTLVVSVCAVAGWMVGLGVAHLAFRGFLNAILRTFGKIAWDSVPGLQAAETVFGLGLALAAGLVAGRLATPLPRTLDA